PAAHTIQGDAMAHTECDPACPTIVHFLTELLDDATPYAPLDLRLECFEATHIRQCERCERFSRAFQAWLEQNAREREAARRSGLDHVIAEQRQFLRQLNGLEG